jgi:hypothetical protein
MANKDKDEFRDMSPEEPIEKFKDKKTTERPPEKKTKVTIMLLTKKGFVAVDVNGCGIIVPITEENKTLKVGDSLFV